MTEYNVGDIVETTVRGEVCARAEAQGFNSVADAWIKNIDRSTKLVRPALPTTRDSVVRLTLEGRSHVYIFDGDRWRTSSGVSVGATIYPTNNETVEIIHNAGAAND